MALFEYQALDGSGKPVSGIIDADTPKHARQKLRVQNIFPVEIVLAKDVSSAPGAVRSIFAGRVSIRDIAIMTRQFSTLVRAGMPIVESLSALVDQVESSELRKVMAEIREEVKEGKSLAYAMEKFPKVFSNLYMNIVMAGEKSGTLEIMLERMADNLEAQVKQKNKISAILWYPAVMLSLCMVIVGFLVVSVIPKVVTIFDGMEKALPLPTIILISVSDFLTNWWGAIIFAMAISYLGFNRYAKTEKGQLKLDAVSIRMPVYGKVMKMLAVSRLTRTLSTLISSGVPLLEAIGIAKKVVGNKLLESVLDDVSDNIREGESMAAPLKRSGMFPPLLTHMIAIGEKSGELEEMLVKVADVYDNEVDTIVDKLTSVLPTVMTLFMGVIVAFIVMAILLPIFDLSQGVG